MGAPLLSAPRDAHALATADRRARSPLNDDFLDLLQALLTEEAAFLVVGAHALAVHGVPRATGDLDVWVEATSDNARRVRKALERFGAPVSTFGLECADLAAPGNVLQIGVPPRRIDLLTGLSGLDFTTAWSHRVVLRVARLDVPFLGREDLLANKRATGRTKDLADIEALEESGPQ